MFLVIKIGLQNCIQVLYIVKKNSYLEGRKKNHIYNPY